jgi:tetratricopeptide (TPR) repeat protein
MIRDPTQHRSHDSTTLRRAAAAAVFLSVILGASAGLAASIFRYGSDESPDHNPHDPATYGVPKNSVAPVPGGSADLKTCDKGLVWNAKKKKCIIKRSDVSPDNDPTTCAPGQAWDTKGEQCLQRHSGVLPDPELTVYAFALAKADRYQEAIDVLDLLDNPNTPQALNCRGYATRRLGRTEEGIGYYLKSVALDPAYPLVREYLGEAYVIEGKFDLAKDQLATIERLCGSKNCEYYEDLARALEQAHAL